jgi:hypothetical protein
MVEVDQLRLEITPHELSIYGPMGFVFKPYSYYFDYNRMVYEAISEPGKLFTDILEHGHLINIDDCVGLLRIVIKGESILQEIINSRSEREVKISIDKLYKIKMSYNDDDFDNLF